MKINFKTSCLFPAAVQTVLMILFTVCSLIPASAGLPSSTALMPYFLFPTLIVFIWNLVFWLKAVIRSEGKDSNWFGTSLLIIIINIAIMGYLMPPMGGN